VISLVSRVLHQEKIEKYISKGEREITLSFSDYYRAQPPRFHFTSASSKAGKDKCLWVFLKKRLDHRYEFLRNPDRSSFHFIALSLFHSS
jgi:hypothetical protein